MGFDVFFDPTLGRRCIMEISRKEKRTIITERGDWRDFREVTHLVQVRRGLIEAQIREVVDLLDLGDWG